MLTRSSRLRTLFFVFIALAALFLLSSGLSELEFSYGEPFSMLREAEAEGGELELPPFRGRYVRIILYIFAGLQLLLPLAIVYFLISREARRRVLRTLLSLSWIVALYFLIRSGLNTFPQSEALLPDTLPLGEALPTDVEFAYRAPQWLVIVMTIGLAISIATLLVGIALYIRRRIQRKPSSLEQLAQEAQEAIDALQAGADLKNTVIRCYHEMSLILFEQRGMKRTEAMTPREFERDLEDSGLPGEQVRALTRLFEMVRYGAKIPDEGEEKIAIDSLSSIVDSIRNSA